MERRSLQAFKKAPFIAFQRFFCAMAERRVLCLLGPVRVDGVGVGTGSYTHGADLRGLDGVDTVRH